jgi:16S rRNA (guanine527-N7)-methyltransferase
MILSHEASARAWLKSLPEWNSEAGERLDDLAALLTAENDVQNLVSDTSLADLWIRHYADSAQLLKFVPRETSSPWLDLGTGAGFPGLVIAILRPDCRVEMVESRSQRDLYLTPGSEHHSRQ